MQSVVAVIIVSLIVVLSLYHRAGDLPQAMRSKMLMKPSTSSQGDGISTNDDWKRAAMALNRILFILFFTVIIAVIAVFIVCFVVLPEFL
jgi:hypothetical protein